MADSEALSYLAQTTGVALIRASEGDTMTRHGPSPPLSRHPRCGAATVIWLCKGEYKQLLLLLMSSDANGTLLRDSEVLGEETRGVGCVGNAAWSSRNTENPFCLPCKAFSHLQS